MANKNFNKSSCPAPKTMSDIYNKNPNLADDVQCMTELSTFGLAASQFGLDSAIISVIGGF